jgi:hypothetical protein
MTNYLIIRAIENGGKTTTAGLVYEDLSEVATYKKLFNYAFEEIPSLIYDEYGTLSDFIGVLVINGKLIIILSQGDISEDLKELLEKLKDENFLFYLTSEKFSSIDILVCCARSRNRENSTYRLLINCSSEKNRFEFWTKKSEYREHMLVVKYNIVNSIKRKIQELI